MTETGKNTKAKTCWVWSIRTANDCNILMRKECPHHVFCSSRKEKSKSPKLMSDFQDFFVFKLTIFAFCFSHCLFSFHRFGSPFLWLGFASACCFSCHRCGVPASGMHFYYLKKEGAGRGGRNACPPNAQPPLLCHFFLCCLMLTSRTRFCC